MYTYMHRHSVDKQSETCRSTVDKQSETFVDKLFVDKLFLDKQSETCIHTCADTL